MSTALHYDSARQAKTAATKRGETQFEVHATRLWPVLFDGSEQRRFVLDLKRLDQTPCHVDPVGAASSLGFDVVSVSIAEFKGAENRCDYLPFDCAPLSCNGMAAEIPVNRWCLLDRLEDAVAAATKFAKEEPEPGPFVIVEVLRCET
jgi:hypothetical protein